MQLGLPNTLSGYFELRVNRVVGWVKDAYGTDVANMQIEVRYHGHAIACFEATAERQNGRFVFSMLVEGRFTGADLVTEEVTIYARDSEGNSGRVLLDGAAQLELIREYLGVPVAILLDLDFSSGGNATPYLGAGWFAADTDFTFTDSDDSFITFDAPRDPGTYVLRITAGAIIWKPSMPTQELMVFLNEAQIAHLVATEAHSQFNECTFTHEAFAGSSAAKVRLHHPDAVRPFDLGINADIRRLSFSFKRLTLARLIAVD
jgi:hypothetical protein